MAGQYPPQLPQRTYSPAPRTDSPQNGPSGPYQPAPKRQQLSPNPGSPYDSPGINNIALPSQVYSGPYYGTQANGSSANNGYNPYSQQQQQQQQQRPTPRVSSPNNQKDPYGNLSPPHPRPPNSYTPGPYAPTPYNPYNNTSTPPTNHAINNNYNTLNTAHPPPQGGPTGNMGPPSRPPVADKPMDVNDLTDVISGSGIDLKAEEENLITYSRPNRQTQDNSHDGRTNYYSQNVPGGRDMFYGAGTFNQPAEPPKSAEEMLKEARKNAVRRKAEIKSYHLNDPFIFAASLKRRLDKQANIAHVKTSTNGLYYARPDSAPRQLVVYGPDKNEVLKMVSGQDLLSNESEYVEFLSLLSLAAEERIRNLVEEAAILAKGRRAGSHGIVPADMADLAIGNEVSETANGLPTPGDSAVSSKSSSLKRSYADMNKSSSPTSAETKPPVRLNPIAQHINKIAEKERQQEIVRLEKRQRRADTNRSDSLALGSPGVMGIPPELDSKKGSKAKDQKDAAARKATEAQQHAATTKTMNMALGLGGKMGKKLSWMKDAADPTPSNPYLPKSKIASSSKAGGSGANGVGNNLPKTRMLGELREDRVGGAGIQLRDMISVLEHDGKEKKTLQRAYHMQGRVKR
ncbi:hypothetical protein P7C71_g3257, partial [Lecanoromycetidae sp. Uapishka_2]